jgi:hypothetical protein
MGADGTDNAQTVTDLHLDCYAILGVLPNAEEAVIDEAFENVAQRYDPEHFAGSKDEAQRKLSELANAYAILSDPVRRRRYDLRRRIDALIAPLSASDAPRQKGTSLAPVGRSTVVLGPRRYQLVLPALLGALIVVAVAAAYQYSGRPKAEEQAPSPASPPVAAEAKPAPITQPTAPSAEIPAQPSDAGASGAVTTPAASQATATPQQETKPAPQKPTVARNPPLNRGGDTSPAIPPVSRGSDTSPAPVASESCSDVAIVLGLCKRKSTVKDK